MNTPPKRPLEPQKKAIVIGASSGIGLALAQELARQQYRLALVARREEKLSELCTAINRSSVGQASYYVHNVTEYAEVPALFQQITQDLNGLDMVIYVAGVMPYVAENEYTFEKDKAMLEVNLLGAIAWLNEAAVRFERAQGGQIVGIGSIAGDRGRRRSPAYHASKAGLHTYLESLRNRLSQCGVTVTTIKPGMIETSMLDHVDKKMWPIAPEEAATAMVRAIHKRKQTFYVPARWQLVSLIIQHLPSILFRRLNI